MRKDTVGAGALGDRFRGATSHGTGLSEAAQLDPMTRGIVIGMPNYGSTTMGALAFRNGFFDDAPEIWARSAQKGMVTQARGRSLPMTIDIKAPTARCNRLHPALIKRLRRTFPRPA